MTPEQLQSFFALAIGFAFGGMLTTGFELLTSRPLSFRLLESGPRPSAFAAVPVLAFAAPFLIMKGTLLACRIGVGRFEAAMTATIIAGLWSLMSGTVFMMAVTAISV